jgi:hypothetical protein
VYSRPRDRIDGKSSQSNVRRPRSPPHNPVAG